jgi:NTE family protein
MDATLLNMKKIFCISAALLIIALQSFSQTGSYKNLVLEGGGIRGFAYIGAFEILDSIGILKNIQRVGGTSAGAIQATLLAVGYSPDEMTNIADQIPLKKFNDGFILGGPRRLKKEFGFYRGDYILSWIEDLIENKTGDANITFPELHEQRTEKGYKDLYVTGADLTYQCLRFFSYETFPEMRIKDAVKISLCIPPYYEPVCIDDSGKICKNFTAKSHLMVDGRLLNNYPIQMFDSEQYGSCRQNGTLKENTETLGLMLEKPEQIEQ